MTFKICCACGAPRNPVVTRCLGHAGPYTFRTPSEREQIVMRFNQIAHKHGTPTVPWSPPERRTA